MKFIHEMIIQMLNLLKLKKILLVSRGLLKIGSSLFAVWYLLGFPLNALAATHEITIFNFLYQPPSLEVQEGDIINWVNNDTIPHTVTSRTDAGSPQSFDSPILEGNGRFSYTVPGAFTDGTTVSYGCRLHPDMRASLTLKTNATPSPPPTPTPSPGGDSHTELPTDNPPNPTCVIAPIKDIPETPYTALASFESIQIDKDLTDGYIIEAVDVNGDSNVDLMTSGLGDGRVFWYENPGIADSPKTGYEYKTWKKHQVIQLSVPVGTYPADIDNDGWTDLVISDNYAGCIFACQAQDGRISWLRNPGKFDQDKDWEQFFIGNLMATHRLVVGHFTRTDKIQVMGLPVVGGTDGNVHDPIKTVVYTPSNKVYCKDGWTSEVANDTLRVIHGVTKGKYAMKMGSPLESVMLAGEEGITWLYYGQDQLWHTVNLGKGDISKIGTDREMGRDEKKWKGSGDVDVGRIGDDAFAYIAAQEPFHGNVLALYTKDNSNTLDKTDWTRKVLDIYGMPRGDNCEGAGHHVKMADFDGDGDDEFLIAERGPFPWQGVFYYKAVDLKQGKFQRARISSASAARIAIADYNNDGRLDFATIGYVTRGYYRARDPQVLVFLNKFGRPKSTVETSVSPLK